jgi:putative FmdB family regulatory protein
VPTYQYACTACGHKFDAVQSFSDASLTDCPECTGRLRKVFSSVGIVFKGSGFYRTDSRAKETAGAEKAEKSEKSEKKPADAGSSGGSADSGSAKKEPAKSDAKTSGSSNSGSASSSSSSSTPAAAAS